MCNVIIAQLKKKFVTREASILIQRLLNWIHCRISARICVIIWMNNSKPIFQRCFIVHCFPKHWSRPDRSIFPRFSIPTSLCFDIFIFGQKFSLAPEITYLGEGKVLWYRQKCTLAPRKTYLGSGKVFWGRKNEHWRQKKKTYLRGQSTFFTKASTY